MNISYRDPDEAIDEIIINKVKVFLIKVTVAILIVIGIFIIDNKNVKSFIHQKKEIINHGFH